MDCVVGSGKDCELKLGQSIRIYDETPAKKEAKPVAQETKKPDPIPPPEPEPAPTPVETVAAPAVPDLVEWVYLKTSPLLQMQPSHWVETTHPWLPLLLRVWL